MGTPGSHFGSRHLRIHKEKNMHRIIEHTEDGSATLFVPELNEHYHSVKGARTESQHIFIEMGLQASTASAPRILEVGFGTGLNALLTLQEAEHSLRNVHYTGIELYPLTWSEVAALHYTDDPRLQLLHETIWEKEVQLSPHFTLLKLQRDLAIWKAENETPPFHCDIIYFDAFAPEKQPALWTREIFENLYRCLAPGGLLTTYCAKGIIRRMMQDIGFRMERLPGPPGGKREILRATKPNDTP